MGYELEGFVAKLSTLRAWQRELPDLPVCPLDDTLGLVPGESIAGVGASARACGRKLAEKGMIVFISASEFGDLGGGSAIVWDGGRVTEDVEVNAALRMLGARAAPGSDEFETLDLGHNTARWVGAAAVAALPDGSDAALAKLSDLLRSGREPVRERAAHELRRYGVPAIPLLVEAFRRDREYGVRLNAACSLAAIGDAGVAALLDLLPRTSINDRALPFLSDPAILLLALKGARDVPASAVALVMPLLAESGLRPDAVQLLEAMGPEAAPAVSALAAILRSEPEWYIRSYAVKALAAIGDAPGVAGALDEARRSDEHAEVRRGAEAALKNRGRPLLGNRMSGAYEAVIGHEPKLASMYLGALATLRREENPERFAQAARSLRELLEKLPRYLDMPVPAEDARLGDKVPVPAIHWRRWSSIRRGPTTGGLAPSVGVLKRGERVGLLEVEKDGMRSRGADVSVGT